ncbi:hypothetical protein KFL_003270080 [Klebsormidium nitens]|uniref:Uncharacterized protein n=1 Tax=Klebsormidium nitens TaxID=105231 RepID=A0A1Y1ID65_KLENI|nr:hypothetical protein KFL_003270080 [Klebsormidium nitens]|eukprot:GAQ87041.1 hypothetical protein KFL_003270080 [Klebsormidium nitens]
MTSSARQSILLRPKRPQSQTNQQNIDKEHDAHVAALKAKSEKYRIVESELRKSIAPEKDDKFLKQSEVRSVMEAQLRLKEEMKLAEAEREMAVFEEARGAKFSDEVATREEERQAREKRDYLKQVMEENKKLVALRNEMARQRKQQEIEEDRARPLSASHWDRQHMR